MPGPVLVTGAAGFVGSHLLDQLRTSSEPVVAWRRPGAAPPAAAPAVDWMEVDLLDRDAVCRAVRDVKPGAVYHLAGAAHVAESWQHTRATYEGNVLVTHHLFEALRLARLGPRVLVAGSATIYASQDHPITEEDELHPISPYATSKLAQELLARRAHLEDGLPTLLARAFNHIGPGQPPSYVAPSIARQIALIEAGRLDPVLTMGSLTPRRDLMDVRDTVVAYSAMMRAARPGRPYNVCTGHGLAIGSLVEALVHRAHVRVRIVQDPARLRPNDPPLLVGDHTCLSAETGWQPAIPFEQTVDDLLAYWRARVAAEHPSSAPSPPGR